MAHVAVHLLERLWNSTIREQLTSFSHKGGLQLGCLPHHVSDSRNIISVDYRVLVSLSKENKNKRAKPEGNMNPPSPDQAQRTSLHVAFCIHCRKSFSQDRTGPLNARYSLTHDTNHLANQQENKTFLTSSKQSKTSSAKFFGLWSKMLC